MELKQEEWNNEFDGFDYTPSKDKCNSRDTRSRLPPLLPLSLRHPIVTPQSNETESTASEDQQLPPPPKTAFMCFCESWKNNCGVEDINLKDMAAQWRALSADEKETWHRRSVDDKARYNKERMDFIPTSKSVPKRRAKKHPLAPKRPMSAFLKYSMSRRSTVKNENPDMNNTDISRLLGEMWRNASEDEKKPYREVELKERAAYNEEIKRWRIIQKKKEIDIISSNMSIDNHSKQSEESQQRYIHPNGEPNTNPVVKSPHEKKREYIPDRYMENHNSFVDSRVKRSRYYYHHGDHMEDFHRFQGQGHGDYVDDRSNWQYAPTERSTREFVSYNYHHNGDSWHGHDMKRAYDERDYGPYFHDQHYDSNQGPRSQQWEWPEYQQH